MGRIETRFKQTEVGLVPEDWEVKKLGDIAEIVRGASPRPIEDPKWFNNNSLIGWVRISDVTSSIKTLQFTTQKLSDLGVKSSRYVERGNLIMSICATIGRPILTLIDVCIHDGFVVFRKPIINKEYLYYFLSFIEKDWSKNGQTGSQMNLNTNLIKTREIQLPTKAEQTLIANALSDADLYIESLEKLIAKKQKIKQGSLQQLLKPKPHWEVKPLKEIVRYRRGSFPQPYGLEKWYDDINGAPFIQVFDVDDNKLLKSETKCKISKAAQEMSVFVKKGSIVLTIQGSIGRIAITQYDSYVDRTLLIFESFLEKFDRYFFMISVWVLFEYEKESAPGGIIKTITKESLSSFKISFPDYGEQKEIAQTLSDIDSEITVLNKKLTKAKAIKQGMMQQLLTGKIRLI